MTNKRGRLFPQREHRHAGLPAEQDHITTFANLAKVALTAAQRSPKSRFGSACLLHRRSAKSSSGSFSPRHGGMDVRPASGAAARKPTRTGGDRTDTTNKRGITRTQIPDVGDLGRIPTRTQIPDVGNLARIAEVRHAAASRCGQRRDAKTSSGSFSPRHGGEVIHCTTNMTPRPRVVQKSTVSRIHLPRCWPASMAVGCSSSWARRMRSVADCRMHYLTMHEKQCMATAVSRRQTRCQSRRSRHRVRRWPSSATLSFGSIWFFRGTRYNVAVWRCRKPLRRVTWNVRFASLPFCHFVKTARRARDVVIRVGRVG